MNLQRSNYGAQNGGSGSGHRPPAFRGLCTRTHTYAVALDGRWLLFDNKNDPYQQRNLIDDYSQQSLIKHFDGMIAAWLKEASDPFPFESASRQRSAESV